MNATTLLAKKLGRKRIGETNLLPAERQRRYREKLRKEGAKDYFVTLPAMYVEYVDALASAGDTTPSTALRTLLEASLIRYVGVMNRVARLAENGATEEAQAQFIHDHMHPELPPMEPLEENL